MVGVLIPDKSASTTNQVLAFTEMVSQHTYASWHHMENFGFFFYHIGFSFWVFLTFLFILLPKHSISVYSLLNIIHFNTIGGFFFNWSIVDLQCCNMLGCHELPGCWGSFSLEYCDWFIHGVPSQWLKSAQTQIQVSPTFQKFTLWKTYIRTCFH